MTGFLIPIRAFTPHTLAAIRFAIEFSKRSDGILYFLFVDDPDEAPVPGGNEPCFGMARGSDFFRKEIEELIDAGKSTDGVQMQTHFRSGDYMQEVQRFAAEHYVTEIVVSLPDEQEETFEQTQKDIQLMLKMTHCRVLTVKQKEKELH